MYSDNDSVRKNKRSLGGQQLSIKTPVYVLGKNSLNYDILSHEAHVCMRMENARMRIHNGLVCVIYAIMFAISKPAMNSQILLTKFISPKKNLPLARARPVVLGVRVPNSSVTHVGGLRSELFCNHTRTKKRKDKYARVSSYKTKKNIKRERKRTPRLCVHVLRSGGLFAQSENRIYTLFGIS